MEWNTSFAGHSMRSLCSAPANNQRLMPIVLAVPCKGIALELAKVVDQNGADHRGVQRSC